MNINWMAVGLFVCVSGAVGMQETLPALKEGVPPQTSGEMWAGFDPRAEPLEVEVLKEWEQDGVVLKVLRYRIGVFKGEKAMMAAVYGYPKGGKNLPGVVQLHRRSGAARSVKRFMMARSTALWMAVQAALGLR